MGPRILRKKGLEDREGDEVFVIVVPDLQEGRMGRKEGVIRGSTDYD